MEVLVGGQKVKLESQNSDKKSKYWKGINQLHSLFSAIEFLAVELLSIGVWIWFFMPYNWKEDVGRAGKAHALCGIVSTSRIFTNVWISLFIHLNFRQKHIFMCVPGKSIQVDSHTLHPNLMWLTQMVKRLWMCVCDCVFAFLSVTLCWFGWPAHSTMWKAVHQTMATATQRHTKLQVVMQC